MAGIPVVGAHEEASCLRFTRVDLVLAGFVSTRGGLVMAGCFAVACLCVPTGGFVRQVVRLMAQT